MDELPPFAKSTWMDELVFERFTWAITLANKTHGTCLSECKQFRWPTNKTN